MIFGYLLFLVPDSGVLTYVLHASPTWVFLSAILAIVPLAEWIRRATEQMARLDNGFGAAHLAASINRRMQGEGRSDEE